jgi:hypothetical protein
MGISRACASKWVNRFRQFGELGLEDRSSAPRSQPTAAPAEVITHIEAMRRARKWSAARIAFELGRQGVRISRRTVSRQLVALGLNRRRFIDPDGDGIRVPQRIVARRPGHMIHVDVKKVGRTPKAEAGAPTAGAAHTTGPSNAPRLQAPGPATSICIQRSTGHRHATLTVHIGLFRLLDV